MKGENPEKIVVVCGPTGSGKTGFAINLARQFDGEIVGADSMQVYRQMDIGTAKPTPAEQAVVVHHMIDIVNPDQAFDAARYAQMAADCIGDILARKKTVFLVGGTGLYIKALLFGLCEQGPSAPSIRAQLKREASREGSVALHRRLRAVDPSAADRIHPNDTYRLVRALEVHAVTGESLTVFQRRHGFRKNRFTALEIALFWPRPILYDRINKRVDLMMDMGFYQEVQRLLKRGYGPGLKSMQSLGYRHLAAVIGGDLPLAEAVALIKRDHRRYAKRQLTWFGAQRALHWLLPDQQRRAVDLIRAFS